MRDALVKEKSSFSPVLRRSRTLQRQCACGSGESEIGSCAACARKQQLQRQLSIGESHDAFELEADRIARRVVSNEPQESVSSSPLRIQRISTVHGASRNYAPASVHQALTGSGSPLPPRLRGDMEQRLGFDLSRVRVHTSSVAQQSAREVNGLAYTVGNDIVFGADQYAPHTIHGQRLIAHELVHTIQQAANPRLARVQRQPAGDAQNEPTENRAMREGVPYEKWSEQVEGLYRKVRDPRAAAVARCRTQGGSACAMLLTLQEVDALYQLAQEAKGDEQKVKERVPQITPAAGMMNPGTGFQPPSGPQPPWITGGGAGAAEAATARAAAARAAAARAAAAAATTGEVGTAAGTGAAAAEGTGVGTGLATGATVAGVTIIVAVVVIAGIQLWKLGCFQEALRQRGFVILEDPLAQAICYGCHSAPRKPIATDPNTDSAPWRRFPDFDPDLARRFLKPTPKTDTAPQPTPDVKPQEEPDERKRSPRLRGYPICWPVNLPPPMTMTFARVKGADRDEDDARQARMQAEWRAFRDPSFNPKEYHAHHITPLFLGGADDLRRNGMLWPARMHLRGHAWLRNQPQMLRPPPPLIPLPPDIYDHPGGTPYRLAGFKITSNEECV